MADHRETFLSRWSRLKQETQQKEENQQPAAAAPAPAQPDVPPELPPLEKLTLDSNYRDFFHPKVNEDLRRAALKRLFGDPHFNVMDGLDVYIDDYSKPSPLPAEMLAGLRQAQKILEWAKETAEGEKKAETPAIGATDTPQLDAGAGGEPAAESPTASVAGAQPAGGGEKS